MTKDDPTREETLLTALDAVERLRVLVYGDGDTRKGLARELAFSQEVANTWKAEAERLRALVTLKDQLTDPNEPNWFEEACRHKATIEQVRDLHRPTDTNHACHAGCHGSWPCPTAALVGGTQ
jgi:hypothetical protein